MTRNNMWFIAVAISALATSSAYAAGEKMGGESSTGSKSSQVTTPSGSASFADADADRNGAIDSNEAAAVTGLDFTSADTDQDGKLSRSEFEAAARSGSSSSKPSKSGSGAVPDRQPDGGPGK